MKRKAAILHAFTAGFRKFVGVVFYFSWLCHNCELQGSFYDCLWRGDKGTWYRNVFTEYYRWPELWHCSCCFVQSVEGFTVKGNKRMHTHSNTHTHTHTHVRSQPFPDFYRCSFSLVFLRVTLSQVFQYTWGGSLSLVSLENLLQKQSSGSVL